VHLANHEVHVWRAGLDVRADRTPALFAVLDPQEAERAQHCRLPRERMRFVAAHAALRTVLARYTGLRPVGLRFGRTRRGRPYLLDAGDEWLDFSMSHSGATALIAVTRIERVGIDIEEINSSIDHKAMAHRFLASDDAYLIHRLADEEGRRVFFTRWTWREAYAKATDRPVPRVLDHLDLSTIPIGVGQLALWNLPVGRNACGTVATARTADPPSCWTLMSVGVPGRPEQRADPDA